MDYEQIKRDVKKFREIAKSFGLYGHCALGSLMLEYCLEDHGIKSELVKGYVILENSHWILHIWNKVYISEKEIKQIDIVYNHAKDANISTQYTLVLKDKWKSSIETEKEMQNHDGLIEFMRIYREIGRENALKYLKKHKQEDLVDKWEWIFGIIAQLKTFQGIRKYKDLFFA